VTSLPHAYFEPSELKFVSEVRYCVPVLHFPAGLLKQPEGNGD
jgi:hypothetical protein